MDVALKLFILGVTVSFGPCLAHCSLVILPYIAGTAHGWKEGLKSILVFLLVRLAIYGLFGLLAGLIGRAVIIHLLQFEPQMIFIGSGFITFLGLYVIFKKEGLHNCQLTSNKHDGIVDLGQGLCQRAFRNRNDGGKGSALLGLFTGVVPCLPLLGVLTFIALYAQDFWQGAFYGLAFGGGKFISPLIPLSILAGAAPALFGRYNRVFHYFTKLCGFMLLFIGISLLV